MTPEEREALLQALDQQGERVIADSEAIAEMLRRVAAEAFMAGVKFGGQLPTLKETFEERDWRADKAVEQWRSAR